jgi:hypothetical protein
VATATTRAVTRILMPHPVAEEMYKKALLLARARPDRNPKRVLPLLREATRLKHPMAIHALATWYLFGVGVRKNRHKGLVLEAEASALGIAEAAFNLAYSYEVGAGVTRDPALALRYYKRAARLGDKDALYEVGRFYHYGIGVRASRANARRWFAKARAAGVREAIEDERRTRAAARGPSARPSGLIGSTTAT